MEVVVSVAIMAFILLALISFILIFNNANAKTKADREALENARSILDAIAYEVRGAKSVYTPATNATQLSLETSRYVSTGESTSFLDFFICGARLCVKKESQEPYSLGNQEVEVTNISFVQLMNGSFPSLKISITAAHKNQGNNPNDAASVTLTSAVSLRKY